MKLVMSLPAQADLFQIHNHILGDNPIRANSLIGELQQACKQLTEMPLAYPVVFEDPAGNVRRRVFGECLIFYRVEVGKMVVLQVGQGSRDWVGYFES